MEVPWRPAAWGSWGNPESFGRRGVEHEGDDGSKKRSPKASESEVSMLRAECQGLEKPLTERFADIEKDFADVKD